MQIKLDDTSTSLENAVQIQTQHTVDYEYVCSDELSYSSVAQLICEELGFTGGHVWMESVENAQSPARIQINDCNTQLSDCLSYTNNCEKPGVNYGYSII